MIFQIDRGLKTFLAGLTGLSADLTTPADSDLIISSNAWAFRNRIKQKGSLVLPFVNFRLLPGGIVKPEKTFPKNWALTRGGHYESDIEDRVKALAFTARYEATFWSSKFTNTMYAFQEIFTENYKDFTVPYSYTISGQEASLEAPFMFTNLEFDPAWEEANELDRGKIHSIDLSFEIDTYIFKTIGKYGASNCVVSNDNPMQVTSNDHGLTTGLIIYVETDTGVTGTYAVTVIDDDTFSIEIDNSGGEISSVSWYFGVAPVDDVEVELFYNNGVIDEQDTYDRKFTVTGTGE